MLWTDFWVQYKTALKRYPRMLKPKPLNPGSAVRLIAPASPFEADRLSDGVKILTDFGLTPIWTDRVFQRQGYLAGPDSLRVLELADALKDQACEAVIAIRGGFGVTRIIDELANHNFGSKLVMGFSDITALLIYLNQTANQVVFHGPNVLGMPNLDPESRGRLKAALLGLDWETNFTWAGLQLLRGGFAKGRLLAGNLTLICTLAGTWTQANLAGALLVIEEVNEPLYRIDRLLTQLAMQVQARQLSGVIIGDLGVAAQDLPDLPNVLESFTNRLDCPVVTGFPAGHKHQNHPIPLGIEASLDADLGLLRVLEDPYDRS